MIIGKVEYNGATHFNVDSEASHIPVEVLQSAMLNQAWGLVRGKRDRLLAATDYAIMPDYPLTDAQKAEVTAYRQALRDIPENYASPDAVEWPTKPEILTQ